MEIKLTPEDKALLEALPLPSGTEAWLTRGYLRTSVLRDLQPSDDLDVAVHLSPRTLEESFANIHHRRTIHGGFSLRRCGKRGVDVFAFPMGCGSIHEVMETYEFSCDALAMNLDDGKIAVSEGAESLATARDFDVQEAYLTTQADNDFIYTKAVYLMLRHGLRPGRRLTAIFRKPPTSTKLTVPVAKMFGEELRTLHRTSGRRAVLENFPELHGRLELMLGPT